VPAVTTVVAVYTAIASAHDRRFPHAPAYPSLPLPLPLMSVLGLGVACVTLVLARRAHAPRLSGRSVYEW
jgi:hypothetical protein